LETGKVIRTIHLPSIDDPDVPRGRLIISPDNKMLIGYTDAKLSLWDLATGKKIKDVFTNSPQLSIIGIILSPDGKFLVAKCYSGNSPKQTYMVWDTSTWELQRTFSGVNLGNHGFALSFSPDGNRFVTSGGTGLYDISTWDFNTGKMSLSLDTPRGIYASAYNPSGKYFAVANISYDNPDWARIVLYEADTGKPIRKLSNACVTSVMAFSPDGTRLAAGGSCDRPGMVQIWDLSQP
jgi:WD40 repeat protein